MKTNECDEPWKKYQWVPIGIAIGILIGLIIIIFVVSQPCHLSPQTSACIEALAIEKCKLDNSQMVNYNDVTGRFICTTKSGIIDENPRYLTEDEFKFCKDLKGEVK